MGHARIMRVAGAGVSALHLACGLCGWVVFGLPGALLLFGLCALITLALAFGAAPLLERPPRDDGGLAAPGDEEPPEPPWWPDFERALREHCARERSGA